MSEKERRVIVDGEGNGRYRGGWYYRDFTVTKVPDSDYYWICGSDDGVHISQTSSEDQTVWRNIVDAYLLGRQQGERIGQQQLRSDLKRLLEG